ncbi:MDR family MFS transporter [Paenibacillus xylaniclasticus]|uniref:MDR family MFS transporter n=1 Tax=Paenibacillus xylaniclasticus TaxID=588083 RepID=UPI000FD7B661|nr:MULTISPECIES: MFS transporter [Paenibacillus]GFN32281.1 MFS transporter [Paenibacillus curdlanolyticus]
MVGATNKWIGLLHRYDAAIWIRVAGNAINAMTTFIIRPFLALYLFDKLNGSILDAMLVIGLQPFAGMLTGMLSGGLSDRFGRKPVMIAALFIQVLCLGAYSLADSVWAFAVITAIIGVGSALFTPAANAMISDVVELDKQAEVFALLHTASNVGTAMGPAIGLMLFQWNPNVVFLGSAFVLLAYIFLVLWKVPESYKAARKVEKQAVSSTYSRWTDHKSLYALMLLATPIGLIYALVISMLPFHLGDHFKQPEDILASLMTLNGILVIALQMWLVKRTERFAAASIVGVSYAMFAAVAFGYAYSPYIYLLFITETIFSVAEMLIGPHLQRTVSAIAPEEKRGFYFSIFSLHMHLPLALGPVAGGLLYEAFDGQVLFTMLGLVFVTAGTLQTILIRRLKHKLHRDEHTRSSLIEHKAEKKVQISAP